MNVHQTSTNGTGTMIQKRFAAIGPTNAASYTIQRSFLWLEVILMLAGMDCAFAQ